MPALYESDTMMMLRASSSLSSAGVKRASGRMCHACSKPVPGPFMHIFMEGIGRGSTMKMQMPMFSSAAGTMMQTSADIADDAARAAVDCLLTGPPAAASAGAAAGARVDDPEPSTYLKAASADEFREFERILESHRRGGSNAAAAAASATGSRLVIIDSAIISSSHLLCTLSTLTLSPLRQAMNATCGEFFVYIVSKNATPDVDRANLYYTAASKMLWSVCRVYGWQRTMSYMVDAYSMDTGGDVDEAKQMLSKFVEKQVLCLE